jgi:hypothetical protein
MTKGLTKNASHVDEREELKSKCAPEPLSDVDKADDTFVEHAANPYLGLSSEDADFMRQYKGSIGKKVVLKVCWPAIEPQRRHSVVDDCSPNSH